MFTVCCKHLFFFFWSNKSCSIVMAFAIKCYNSLTCMHRSTYGDSNMWYTAFLTLFFYFIYPYKLCSDFFPSQDSYGKCKFDVYYGIMWNHVDLHTSFQTGVTRVTWKILKKKKTFYKMCFRSFMAQNINKALFFYFFCSHLSNVILLVHYV